MEINVGGEQRFSVQMSQSDALAATTGVDRAASAKIAELISEPKTGENPTSSHFLTETRFNRNGIERRTLSDFGFIGWIMTQLAKDE
jgi:hypothetical protein